jgi:hypothetical protein
MSSAIARGAHVMFNKNVEHAIRGDIRVTSSETRAVRYGIFGRITAASTSGSRDRREPRMHKSV